MTVASLSRKQRRDLQKLADQVDRVTQADARFFERFPDRRHRVRVMSCAEIEQHTVLIGEVLAPQTDRQFFSAVKQIAPGVRLRLSVEGPKDAETDLPEEQARAIYESVNTGEARQIEASMLAQFAGGQK